MSRGAEIRGLASRRAAIVSSPKIDEPISPMASPKGIWIVLMSKYFSISESTNGSRDCDTGFAMNRLQYLLVSDGSE
jgi:hypothetical protein